MVEKSEKKVDVNFNVNNCKGWKNQTPRSCGGGAIYGLGIIGGWVYFIGQAGSFWAGVGGFFQGIFWPAYMVYEVFNTLIK